MSTIYDRRDGGAVVVTGPDAVSFVDALVSQDVQVLADGDGAHSLLLSPQGKLVVDFRVLRVGDELWCDTDPGYGAVLAEGLNRFRIRVKAEVADRSDAFGVLSVRGADARAGAPVAGPDRAHAHVPWGDGGLRVVRADWPDGTPGYDVVGPRAALDDVVAAGALGPLASEAEHEAARIAAGVLVQGRDTDDGTIPQEAYLDRTAVSFTKGCFLGQELVCRIDAFGRVNTLLRLVHLGPGTAAEPGAEVELDGRPVGRLTSVAGDLAIAALRRDVEVPTAVGVGGVAARAELLPGRVDATDDRPVAKARLGLRRG